MDHVKLASGELIDVTTGKRTVDEGVNDLYTDEKKVRAGKGRSYEGSTRRYISDLPLPAEQSRALVVIVGYSLFGLNAADIASILKTSPDMVREFLESPEYGTVVDAILQNVREHDSNKVRKKLNAAAERASDTIVSLMDSDDEKVQFNAAKDILDRNGHRPNDVVEHKHSMDGGLTIRILDESKDVKKQLTVDMDM